MNKKITITASHLNIVSVLYLVVPVLIWFIGWTKIYVAITVSIGILLSLFFIIKNELKKRTESKRIEINVKKLLFLISVALIWCFISGIGRYYYQSYDHSIRNATFNELITRPWPVSYDFGAYFTYYFAIWLLPALIGKIFGTAVAYFSLYILCAFGLVVMFLHICVYFNKSSFKAVLFISMVTIFFSGMDIIGFIFRKIFTESALSIDHIETWAYLRQFSSNMTQMMWIFNQSIPVWLSIMLLINSDDIKYYGVVMASTSFFSPMPLVGLVPICLIFAYKRIKDLYKKSNIKAVIKDIFTFQNILFVFIVFPICYKFLTMNLGVTAEYGLRLDYFPKDDSMFIVAMILFVILEYAIYCTLLFKNNKKNPVFYCIVIEFLIMPLFRFGVGYDFCMRFSIPPLFIMMLLIMEFFFSQPKDDNGKIKKSLSVSLMCICLLIGTVTPLTEQLRAVTTMIEEGKIAVTADDIKSLDDINRAYEYPHYFTFKNAENSKYYKYFIR